ncbi:MAG TPA: TonB family protein [Thermoanaerobaculia bacterium]|nr:TonB family protein [Thermoanaerobaculia bacterium]
MTARLSAEPKSPAALALPRGTALKVREGRGDAVHVVADGRDVWIPAGSFERMADREAREKRAAAVALFPPQRARAVESCPILLAPDYGAARWGTLDDGEDVDVVLADHDFFGVRLAGKILAFVPARSIRLLPSAVPAMAAGSSGRGVVPEVQALAPSPSSPGAGTPAVPALPTPPSAVAAPALPRAPLASLPEGAEPPVLVTRVDARYPEAARRMNLSGEVVLRIVVEANGTVGRIDVLSPGPAGMTEAAGDAVRRWTFRPARIAGQPVAVWKVVRVRFSRTAEREPPPD